MKHIFLWLKSRKLLIATVFFALFFNSQDSLAKQQSKDKNISFFEEESSENNGAFNKIRIHKRPPLHEDIMEDDEDSKRNKKKHANKNGPKAMEKELVFPHIWSISPQ